MIDLIKFFDTSTTTITARMLKYSLGKNVWEIRENLIKPFIQIGAEDGLPLDLVLKMINENGITFLEGYSLPIRALRSACKRIFKKSYDQLRRDLGGDRTYSLTNKKQY